MKMSKSSSNEVTGQITKTGVSLYGKRCVTVTLLFAVCVALAALLANGRVKKTTSNGFLTSSSDGRNATASDACGRKAVCGAADWRNIQLCGLGGSDGDQRSQLEQLQKRWDECAKQENVCDECVELGIREELNLTWIRFAEYVTNPPDNDVTQRNETIIGTYRPVFILCDPDTSGLSVCDGRSVNISYLLQGGFRGQDCRSTEYLLGLPYAPYMIDEVIELCADPDNSRKSE